MGSFVNLGFNCQGDYLDEFIDLVRSRLQSKWDLIFAFHKNEIPEPKNPTLVFLSGQEDHSLDTPACRFENVKLVFRQHSPHIFSADLKLRPIPLTPIVKFDKSAPILKISQRKYDYFWAGVRNVNRDSLHQGLEAYQAINPNGIVYWSEGWGKGLDQDRYAYYLSNSKVSFAPCGWVSPETYRYSEIIRAGCIALADPQLGFWYNYRSAHLWPGVWQELSKFMPRLLANLGKLDRIQNYSLQYYDKFLSPTAVANYVFREVAAIN